MSTKGRKATPAATDVVDNFDAAAAHRASAAATELATVTTQVAELFDEGRVYNRERLISEARFFMAKSGEAFCEAGKRLVVIKENEPHGEFIEVLDRLGVEKTLAQRAMKAALKFLGPGMASKAAAPQLLGLSQTKLIELLAEPDEAIEALAEGGTVAGMTLDDIQSMTSRELRAALLEARKAAAAKDAVIAKKDAKLNKLAEDEAARRAGSVDEQEQLQLDDLRNTTLAVEQTLAELVAVIDQVMSAPASDAAALAARQTLDFTAQRLSDAAQARGMALNLEDAVLPAHMKTIRDAVLAANPPAKGGKGRPN